jgi:hypothetical protein
MTRTSYNLPVDFSQAEHLVLEGDETDVAASLEETLTISAPRLAEGLTQEWQLTDRAQARELQLRLFASDLLTLSETRRGKPLRKQDIDLRHLDPECDTRLHVPRRCLMITAGLGGLSGLCLLLTAVLPAATALTLASIAAVTATAIAALLAAYRTREQFVYRTRHGRAPALRWQASFGSLRKSRRLLPQLSAAIREAATHGAHDQAAVLRAEMREHYRLKETAVISSEECSQAAHRILAHFG